MCVKREENTQGNFDHLFFVADSSSQFDYSPNADPISDVSRCGTSYSPERCLPPTRPYSPDSPVRSPPSAEPLLLARSRASPARLSSPRLGGSEHERKEFF